MRTLKLMTIGIVLALTGAVYAAGAIQETTKTTDKATAEKSCCRMKRDGTQTAAHKGIKHEGEGCCAGGACCGGGNCCLGGTCDMKHKGGHAATAHKTTAGEKTSDCCSGGSCCGGGNCSMHHKKDARAAKSAHAAASCCTEGAACCKGGGQACCKAHKADAKQGVATANAKEGDPSAASCCDASCSCCGSRAGHTAQAGGH